MTFAKSRVGSTLTIAGSTLKRNYWLWPILALLLLSTVGYLVQASISYTMKSNLASQLETLLNVETSLLDNWYGVQMSSVEAIANRTEVRRAINSLLQAGDESPSGSPNQLHDLRATLDREIMGLLNRREHQGYVIVDPEHRVIASSNLELVGKENMPQFSGFVSRALNGNLAVSAPFQSVISLKDANGNYRAGTPTMFVAAPIRDDNLHVAGVLALRLPPEKEFTRILQIGRVGESGETYAFDKNGTMVSNSRFDNDLILNGILSDHADSQSILNVQIRDPGVDMSQGLRPSKRRADLPLTKMVQSAVSGTNGVDVQGYADYRGVSVVGAWKWLPDYEIGVATEIDSAEAFHSLTILSRVFWGLFSLLFVASIAILGFTLVVGRVRREAQKAAIQAQQLGQYRLEEKLGAGAMGTVFKGYHAMMRRPTAIKLLNVDRISNAGIARFEREVQITCQLNHPNTIAIYDYGRTPEGVFYYAMEYLDGIDLQELVDIYGPQPESRVIQIMLQICGSLYEAHAQGLVHRDIKPANLMLNRRGGQPDVVKVLDFGLVKQVDAGNEDEGLAGTPLYMSPEAIQSPALVDACSDLYAVGAVGYFLLTGRSVFDAKSLVELMQMHVTEAPVPPSLRTKSEVSPDFENVLLGCLEKSRARRPQTARDLALQLQRCRTASDWQVSEAEAWWSNHERRRAHTSDPVKLPNAATKSSSVAQATHSESARSEVTVTNSMFGELVTRPTSSDIDSNSSQFDQTMMLQPPKRDE